MNLSTIMPDVSSRYKIDNIDISTDRISETTYIDVTYRLPRFMPKQFAVHDFNKYDNKAVIRDEFHIGVFASGWDDSACKTYRMTLVVTPKKLGD